LSDVRTTVAFINQRPAAE